MSAYVHLHLQACTCPLVLRLNAHNGAHSWAQVSSIWADWVSREYSIKTTIRNGKQTTYNCVCVFTHIPGLLSYSKLYILCGVPLSQCFWLCSDVWKPKTLGQLDFVVAHRHTGGFINGILHSTMLSFLHPLATSYQSCSRSVAQHLEEKHTLLPVRSRG